MNPIQFKEQTTVLAKDQPQFMPLPVAISFEKPNDPTSLPRFTCKYEFTDLEMEQFKVTKCMFINQFGYGFHPIYPQTYSPFLACRIMYKSLGNKTYAFSITDNEGKLIEFSETLENVIRVIYEKTGLQAEQLLFLEKPTAAVNESGEIVDL